MRPVVAFLALSIAASASAAVYKWVQPDGSVMYSDRPPVENAAPAELPGVQEIKMPPPPPPSTDNGSNIQSGETQTVAYTKLEIAEPADQSTFRNNAGRVNVKLDVEPALQEGDVVAIFLDGKEIGQGKSTTLSLSNVDRGTHTLKAIVKNSQGSTVISAAPITFTLQRTSVLQPQRVVPHSP
jgi:Domain of unknown function (DUF4124)